MSDQWADLRADIASGSWGVTRQTFINLLAERDALARWRERVLEAAKPIVFELNECEEEDQWKDNETMYTNFGDVRRLAAALAEEPK